MATAKARAWATGVWRLAEEQHGVVTRKQLLGLGMSPEAIRQRLANGRLHRTMAGVYAIGRPQLDQRGRWMAAVLACGPGALLSHRSAAALWGIQRRHSGLVEVTIPPEQRVRRPGIRVHRLLEPVAAVAIDSPWEATMLKVNPHLLSGTSDGPSASPRGWSYRWRLDGIRVTGPIPTLVDLAASSARGATEAAVNEADHLDLIDPEHLRVGIDLLPRRPGSARLRALLDQASHALSTTELERLFLPLAHEAGLPLPSSQVQLGAHRVDFIWPRLDLVVETDSLRYHRTAFKQSADKRRDNANARRGLTTLRFTHGQVRYEPSYVKAELVGYVRALAKRGR
jgi:hypothetical protein